MDSEVLRLEVEHGDTRIVWEIPASAMGMERQFELFTGLSHGLLAPYLPRVELYSGDGLVHTDTAD